MIVGESVTRLRPAGTDAYGDPIAGESGELDIAGCALAPRSSSLAPRSSSDVTDQGRQGVIAGMTLYAPAGADIEATDQIFARGETWAIDGEVGDWRNPHTGAQPGLEVALKRVAG